MALRAGGGEVCRDVIRVRRALKILHVAGHARRAGQVVVVVRMAVSALPGRHGVGVGQRKTNTRVIELRVDPGIRDMARSQVVENRAVAWFGFDVGLKSGAWQE